MLYVVLLLAFLRVQLILAESCQFLVYFTTSSQKSSNTSLKRRELGDRTEWLNHYQQGDFSTETIGKSWKLDGDLTVTVQQWFDVSTLDAVLIKVDNVKQGTKAQLSKAPHVSMVSSLCKSGKTSLNYKYDENGTKRVEKANLPVNYNSLLMTKTPSVWKLSTAKSPSTKGQGTTICVIDSGIAYQHPAFGSCSQISPNIKSKTPCPKVFFGFDVNAPNNGYTPGNGYDSGAYCPGWNPSQLLPTSEANHGTHVAGIAAGNDEIIQGVAPLARLGSYKVFKCEGYGPNDPQGLSDATLIRAAEKAVLDGCDVINMSIGSSYGDPNGDPLSVAFNKLALASRSIFSISMGNDGYTGTFSTDTPASAPDMMGVASVVNTFNANISTATLINLGKFDYRLAEDSPNPPTPPSSFSLSVYPEENGCIPVSSPEKCQALQNTYVLISDSVDHACRYQTQAANAEKCGAVGTILYSPGAPTFTNFLIHPAANNPSMIILQSSVPLILEAIKKGVKVQFPPNTQHDVYTPLGQDSSSSRGISPYLLLKPDISAPGGNIYSSVASTQQPYALYSGTSMASPQMAGAWALLTQTLRENRNPNIVKDWSNRKSLQRYMKRLVMSTADPFKRFMIPNNGMLEGTFVQGSGMLNVLKAATTPLRVVVDGQIAGEMQTRLIKSLNVSIQSLTGNIKSVQWTSQKAAGVTIDTWPNVMLPSTANPIVSFVKKSLSKSTATCQTKVDASNPKILPAHPEINGQNISSLYGGFLAANVKVGMSSYQVNYPFGGFKGDYNNGVQSGSIIFAGIVQMANNQSTMRLVPPGFTWNLQGSFGSSASHFPVLAFSLGWTSGPVTTKIYSTTSPSTPIGAIDYQGSVSRVPNPLKPTTNAVSYFDGNTYNFTTGQPIQQVPNGEYFVVMEISKIRGETDPKTQIVKVQTPVFRIDYSAEMEPF